eukprot:8060506-Pyramimonas_sp.AAC.1
MYTDVCNAPWSTFFKSPDSRVACRQGCTSSWAANGWAHGPWGLRAVKHLRVLAPRGPSSAFACSL